MDATSLAKPDPVVAVVRSGPTPVTAPVPGTLFDLSWRLGATPPARQRLRLALTDVGRLTVDARRAGVTCGTSIATTSDGPSTLTVNGLPAGARVGGAADTTAPVPAGVATLSVTCP